MRAINFTIVAITCCFLVSFIIAADALLAEENHSPTLENPDNVRLFEHEAGGAELSLNRPKRTLLLKKKLLGAGLVGFGLGLAKGWAYLNNLSRVITTHSLQLARSSFKTPLIRESIAFQIQSWLLYCPECSSRVFVTPIASCKIHWIRWKTHFRRKDNRKTGIATH